MQSNILSDSYLSQRGYKTVNDGTTDQVKSNVSTGWLPWALDELSEISVLQENWDCDDAAAPKPELVDSAKGFLKFIAGYCKIVAPFITATRGGGILFDWKQSEYRLDIQISSPNFAEYACLNRSTKQIDTGILWRRSADDGQFSYLLKHFEP